MRKNLVFAVLMLFLAGVVVSGCAKKAVVREETQTREPVQAVAKAPEKSTAKPAKADWEIKWEAMEKARKEKAALAKKSAAAKPAPAKDKKSTAAAAPAKEMYELTDVHFDFDKFSIRDDERETLKKHAEWLNKNKDVMVVIEGHCDERGTQEYNLALGERRASAAAKYLIDLGVSEKRIKTLSYGLERPLDKGHNEAAWARNRRAHFDAGKK